MATLRPRFMPGYRTRNANCIHPWWRNSPEAGSASRAASPAIFRGKIGQGSRCSFALARSNPGFRLKKKVAQVPVLWQVNPFTRMLTPANESPERWIW